MHLSDHSLGQLDADYLQRLEVEPLRGLSLRLLEDLKEARERLGQNPTNSSRPPSSQAPWDRPSASDTDSSDDEETPLLGEDPDQPDDSGASPEDESEPTPPPAATGEARQPEPPKRKPGKQPGAPGFGRTQVFKAHETIAHRAETCAACAAALGADAPSVAYAGFQTIDLVWGDAEHPGLHLHIVDHRFDDSRCDCGHQTRAQPGQGEVNDPRLEPAALSEWRLGGHRHAKPHALAVELLNELEAIFRVLENPQWPITNHAAEQALRHWVIARRIMMGKAWSIFFLSFLARKISIIHYQFLIKAKSLL